MPFISSRIFVAGGTKKLMTLQNEEHVRFIGSDWTTLRIGMLCALTANGVSNVTGRLAMGVCSGQSNPVGNATNTTNFAGFRTLVGGPTWTYTANSGDPYFSNGSNYGLTRIGNSDTTFGTGTTNINIVSTAPGNASLQRRSLVVIDISKATGFANSYYSSTAQFTTDYSVGDYVMAMEYSSALVVPQFRGVTLTGNTQQTLTTLSQAAGLLDSLDIHWSGTAQALEIYALGVFRKS